MSEPALTEQQREAIARELAQPKRLIYLSFANDVRHLGSCVVEAHGVVTAAIRAHQLGINPGGQVLGMDVPAEAADDLPLDTLLSAEQVGEYFTWAEVEERFEVEVDESGS